MEKIILTTQPELKAIIEQILSDLLTSKTESSHQSDAILTLDQASDYLQVPKGTIYQLTHRREISFNKVGRSLRFRKMDLDSWLSLNKKASKKEIAEKLNLISQ
ncbi:MAG: helix-turn-helix domain-containing protein [Cytophagaceae bacterium]|nr:helix-turn-helix domain-containing protein [Cytophagaceae bacterium]MBK9935264.1 helix-turn-helix domain-containing protein [Cytophagaceae bacterium]MBL0301708.1 helix-turn-helix domain-containing protein [Cytophagaceae bacterium]MBL0324531.1 helix-turn-helix domain-containing protein [Cytophagaceae bacterium]